MTYSIGLGSTNYSTRGNISNNYDYINRDFSTTPFSPYVWGRKTPTENGSVDEIVECSETDEHSTISEAYSSDSNEEWREGATIAREENEKNDVK